MKPNAALRAGEVVLVLPQGTIPRGEEFFDPVLTGKTGVARLAAETGAPVVPVGLWGTEHVWPRSSSLPIMTAVLQPPMVTVRIGAPVPLALDDAVADTHGHAAHRRSAAGGGPCAARAHCGRIEPDPTQALTISPSSSPPSADGLPARSAVAIRAATATNALSRLFGKGSGTVIGGRAGLAVDPCLLATLARGRLIALVSGTNGKTTTTRFLVAALEARQQGKVATNATGANMPAGHVAALIDSDPGTAAVLEVDEGYLGQLIEETRPAVVVLLNLSRDQLDRIAEVRMLADRWRSALGDPSTTAGARPGWWRTPTTRWWCGQRCRRRTWCGSAPDRCGTRTRWAVRPAVDGSGSQTRVDGRATPVTSAARAARCGSRARSSCCLTGPDMRWRWRCPDSSTGPMRRWWSACWPGHARARGRAPARRRQRVIDDALAAMADVGRDRRSVLPSYAEEVWMCGCSWPRTRPVGRHCSTCWTRPGSATVPTVLSVNAQDRRWARYQLAVGRAFRTAPWTDGGGHRRAVSRPRRSAPVRRSRTHRGARILSVLSMPGSL